MIVIETISINETKVIAVLASTTATDKAFSILKNERPDLVLRPSHLSSQCYFLVDTQAGVLWIASTLDYQKAVTILKREQSKYQINSSGKGLKVVQVNMDSKEVQHYDESDNRNSGAS